MELKLRNFLFDRAWVIELLIVPYGIETWLHCRCWIDCCTLLIVPYGIETAFHLCPSWSLDAFNRTLWN